MWSVVIWSVVVWFFVVWSGEDFCGVDFLCVECCGVVWSVFFVEWCGVECCVFVELFHFDPSPASQDGGSGSSSSSVR